MNQKEVDLAEELAKILMDEEKVKGMTLDDFYDKFKVPMEARTNLGTQIIVEKANQIIDNKEKGTPIDKKLPQKFTDKIDEVAKVIPKKIRKRQNIRCQYELKYGDSWFMNLLARYLGLRIMYRLRIITFP